MTCFSTKLNGGRRQNTVSAKLTETVVIPDLNHPWGILPHRKQLERQPFTAQHKPGSMQNLGSSDGLVKH